MILDISTADVQPGKEEAFAAAFKEAFGKLGKVKGLGRWQLLRCVEKPSRFVVWAEWDRIEDHQALAQTPGYAALLGAVGPMLAGAPEILHYKQA